MVFTYNNDVLDFSTYDMIDSIHGRLFRSAISDFAVRQILGIDQGCVRPTYHGRTLSIASAALVESHESDEPHISFCVNRNADIIILCLYTATSYQAVPTDLAMWDFYILTPALLNTDFITLEKVLSLNPIQCDYYGIPGAIDWRIYETA